MKCACGDLSQHVVEHPQCALYRVSTQKVVLDVLPLCIQNA